MLTTASLQGTLSLFDRPPHTPRFCLFLRKAHACQVIPSSCRDHNKRKESASVQIFVHALASSIGPESSHYPIMPHPLHSSVRGAHFSSDNPYSFFKKFGRNVSPCLLPNSAQTISHAKLAHPTILCSKPQPCYSEQKTSLVVVSHLMS